MRTEQRRAHIHTALLFAVNGRCSYTFQYIVFLSYVRGKAKEDGQEGTDEGSDSFNNTCLCSETGNAQERRGSTIWQRDPVAPQKLPEKLPEKKNGKNFRKNFRKKTFGKKTNKKKLPENLPEKLLGKSGQELAGKNLRKSQTIFPLQNTMEKSMLFPT